jgi:hypothetical protein
MANNTRPKYITFEPAKSNSLYLKERRREKEKQIPTSMYCEIFSNITII